MYKYGPSLVYINYLHFVLCLLSLSANFHLHIGISRSKIVVFADR